jgi:nucleotide-binding universal stress UspA family protein
MYNKILVPLDGSDVAECVLPHVEAMAAGNNKVAVTFLYVVQPLDVPMTKPDFKSRIESEAESAAEKYLEKLIAKLKYKEAAQGKVISGKVAEDIIDYATKNKMDLIIMATHGRSGVSRWVSGSVADKVLHGAKTPIWLIRAGAPRATYKKGQKITILVTLDGSELAEAVLSHVKGLVNQFGPSSVDIVLLRVCELFFPPYTYPPPTSLSWEEYLEYETKRCKEICLTYLSKVGEQLKKDGLSVRSEVPTGNPAETIVDYANKKAINLIVMATHGRTGLSRWALGSVADKVLKGATSPIFLVRSTGSS